VIRSRPFSGLTVKPGLIIPESELSERFIHASGPGGQNVNKVASAVQLSFAVLTSPSLPEPVRAALLRSGRLTREGILIITARSFREQDRNRSDARARLAEIIRKAATPPKPRRPTKIPAGSRRKRLESKKQRGSRKKDRAKPAAD
jgi:ribosome-associated protein